MPARFFDSNVLLYSAGPDATKAGVARSRIAEGGTISVQVLNEMVNVGRKKLRLGWAEIDRLTEPFRAMLTIVDLTLDTHLAGTALARRYGLSTYDAMIVAAALAAGCDTLWSEDMHNGLVVDGRLTIRDPFA